MGGGWGHCGINYYSLVFIQWEYSTNVKLGNTKVTRSVARLRGI